MSGSQQAVYGEISLEKKTTEIAEVQTIYLQNKQQGLFQEELLQGGDTNFGEFLDQVKREVGCPLKKKPVMGEFLIQNIFISDNGFTTSAFQGCVSGESPPAGLKNKMY